MYQVQFNPKKGKTTVVITGDGDGSDCSMAAYQYVMKRFDEPEVPTLKPHYVGVASLHPDDQFDEDKGEELALHRAECSRNGDLRVAIREWQRRMLVAIYRVSPQTFDSAVKLANRTINKM